MAPKPDVEKLKYSRIFARSSLSLKNDQQSTYSYEDRAKHINQPFKLLNEEMYQKSQATSLEFKRHQFKPQL